MLKNNIIHERILFNFITNTKILIIQLNLIQ